MSPLFYSFLRIYLIATIVSIALVASCSGIPTKKGPEHVGVDPDAKPYVDEYLWLSAQNHITFKNKVTVGFSNINDGDTVAYCYFGSNFREIEIDIKYWNYYTNTSKLTVLLHELSHCYCHRDHDHAGLMYPETKEGREAEAKKPTPKPGFYDDGCPLSLMYPSVTSDACARAHYQEYTTELFEGCEPY